MTNKKIASEIAIGIILLVAVAIGGIVWLQNKNIKTVSDAVSQQTTVPIISTNQTQNESQVVLDASVDYITSLTTKWSSAGLGQWHQEDLLGQGILGTIPDNSKTFSISRITDPKMHYDELGALFGSINVPYISDVKIYGNTTQLSSQVIASGEALESWIHNTGTEIHQNYCKKYGTDDMRYPGNKTCITNISIVKKINDQVIEWNPEFIGSPDIISVLVGENVVVSFELSQDISRSPYDFREFIQDVAQTLKPNSNTGETANWQTYRNNQFGFELKLPDTWKNYLVRTEQAPSKFEIAQIHFSTSDEKLYFTVVVVDKLKRDTYCANNKNKNTLECLITSGDNIWSTSDQYIYYPFVSQDVLSPEMKKFVDGDLKTIQQTFNNVN